MGMLPIFISLLAASGSFGFPQVPPDANSISAPPTAGSSLVTPWSQWMDLVVPPIASVMPGGKKKKKLLPGPAPPEGTPEAPWTTWTRMKISSALGPSPSPLSPALQQSPPPPPFPMPDNSAGNGSTTDPAVYIQWTQMKLPMTNPASSASPAQETPWDAWTKMKIGSVLQAPPALSKRMAPDRYNIASTAAPRFLGYTPSQILTQQQSGSPNYAPTQQISRPPPQYPSIPSERSPAPSYLDMMGLAPDSTVRFAYPSSGAQSPMSVSGVHFPMSLSPPPQLSRVDLNTPMTRPTAFTPVKVPPSAILATILKPIPHQIISEILAKGTPQEITQVVQTMASIDDESANTPELADVTIQQILPSTLLPKISDELTPLLSTPLVVPPSTPSPEPTGFSLIPASVKTEILKVANPPEISAVSEILSKMEELPLAQQISIANVEVKSILPPTLLQKLPPSVATQLDKKLIPPMLVKALPPPILDAVMAAATPTELASIIDIAAKVELMPPTIPKPPIGLILPNTLIPKLPSQLIPMLKKPVVIEEASPSAPPTAVVPPAGLSIISSAVPPPLYSEIVAKATPAELNDIAEVVALLQAAVPEVASPPVISILPPTLVSKLSPDVKELLEIPVILPATSPLAVIPGPILKLILKVATPEEIPAIVENIALVKASVPVEQPVKALLPPSIIAKLPAKVLPALETPITIPPVATPPPAGAPPSIPSPPPSPMATVIPVLSFAPAPVLPAIMNTATPQELVILADIIEKLEAIPPESKPLVEKVELAMIIPPSLIARLPPQIIPLLSVPVKLPPTAAVPTAPAPETVPAVISPIASPSPSVIPPALSLLPKPILNLILSTATPPELTEIASAISKVEALPPQQIATLSLPVKAVLPPTLVEKLPPPIAPLLATTPLVISSKPEISSLSEVVSPATSPVPITATSPILSTVAPVLAAVPEPVPSVILGVATPTELAELAETIQKLEAVPPPQLAALPPVELATIIPPSLMEKIPPSIKPLLITPIVLPPPSPVAPFIPPTASILSPEPAPILPPVLKVIPEQILTPILAAASPRELNELTETLTKLETLSPSEVAAIPTVPLVSILPPTLIEKLPPTVAPLLSEELTLPLAPPSVAAKVPEALPPPEAIPAEEPLSPPEKKLLTKWAKIILEKTGKPTAPIPGEIPQLQAAWLEWVQLQMNGVVKAPEAATEAHAFLAVTEYPWTKWLKLKSNVTAETPRIPPSALRPEATIPALDITTASPEKAILEWLESMETPTEKPGVVPAPSVPLSPAMEEKVAEVLKKLGIENLDLPPEQLAAVLAEVEKAVSEVASPAPGVVSPVLPPKYDLVSAEVESVPPPTFPFAPPPSYAPSAPFPVYSPVPPFYSFIPPKPFSPYWPPPAPSPFLPPSPLSPSPPPLKPEEAIPPAAPVPTINLTEYLIANNLIPPETPPNAPIPIPTLAKLLEEHALSSTDSPFPETLPVLTDHPITASELAALTPTKFAALLKQILKDCNRTDNLIPRSLAFAASANGGAPYPAFNKGAYYKNKYALKKPGYAWAAGKGKRALYPIPSQAFSPQPTPSEDFQPQPVENMLPLPKMNTTGTIMDPAYWAAQKSMFLSKLFSMLAKVAMNDSTTPSPKEQLAKQVNTVLMSDMTRSIKSTKHHHHTPAPVEVDDDDDAEEEYESSNEVETETNAEPKTSTGEVNENELVTNDNSEPNLPKEPENPLHKLFKFGVQKTVLSDLSTPPPQQPYYIYVTPPPPPTLPALDTQKEMLDKLKTVYKDNKTKSKSSHKKKKKQKSKTSSSSPHRQSHHHSQTQKVTRFRGPTSTTTESPVDFELLAKALLMENNGAKRSAKK